MSNNQEINISQLKTNDIKKEQTCMLSLLNKQNANIKKGKANKRIFFFFTLRETKSKTTYKVSKVFIFITTKTDI